MPMIVSVRGTDFVTADPFDPADSCEDADRSGDEHADTTSSVASASASHLDIARTLLHDTYVCSRSERVRLPRMRTRILISTLLGIGTIASVGWAEPRHEQRHEEHPAAHREDHREAEHREDHREAEHREAVRRDEHREAARHWSREAPPAARYERHEEHRAGYVWVGGRWNWNGSRYDWVGGSWAAERRGYRWREPRYEVRDGEYVYVDGGWDVMRPGAAPPAVREERWEARHGYLWLRGHYDWRDGEYVWVGGHYERERPGYRWREPRWELQGGVYVSVDGGWEAVQ